MYLPSPFARPISSFQQPVEPPLLGVGNTCSISVDIGWLPYVRGALQQLLLESTWKDLSAEGLAEVQGQVFDLIDLFADCGDIPFACPFDFTIQEHGWELETNWTGFDPTSIGLYEPGNGWVNFDQNRGGGTIYSGCDIHKAYEEFFHCSSITVEFGYTPGSFDDPGGTPGFRLWTAVEGTGVVLKHTSTVISMTPGPQSFTIPVNASINDIEIYIITSQHGDINSGACLITNVEVTGTGAHEC